MRIGPLEFTRWKRDPLGRPLHPWEVVTLDQLSAPARMLITKMARVAARDFFEEQRAAWQEALVQELPDAIRQVLDLPSEEDAVEASIRRAQVPRVASIMAKQEQQRDGDTA